MPASCSNDLPNDGGLTDNLECNLTQLQLALGYTFSSRELLLMALTHSSYANEAQPQKIEDNERLEFLGDAVLGMFVSHYLLDKYPRHSEGQLSQLKSGLVSRTTLARIARRLNLGDCLRLGKGERCALGQTKASLLSDALEALIGAVYLDGGAEKVGTVIVRQFEALSCEPIYRYEIGNYKGALQELAQTRLGRMPAYRLTGITGPGHRRVFEVQIKINEQYCVSAEGFSKKQAEQEAAKKMFEKLMQEQFPPEAGSPKPTA